MKQLFFAMMIILTLISCNQQTISYKEISERTEQSKDVVKKFSQLLKVELQTAMKAGGPLQAISVCNLQAPIIAKQLSVEQGWDISRTSLKPRAKSADAWETKIMQSFEQKHADGDKFTSLFAQDIVEINGKAAFRYMQAIETKDICVKCHGANIAADIAQKISELYPNDTATGFNVGDIRGAFSIIQHLD
jgi:hypothetical protein